MSNENRWSERFNRSLFRGAQIAVGVSRHPRTGLYQTWYSLTGHDVNLMTAHQLEADALETISRFNEAWRTGEMATPEAFVKFLRGIPGDARPAPLPQESLLEIGEFIIELVTSEDGSQ